MDTKIKNFCQIFEWKFGKAVGLRSLGLQKVSSLLQEGVNLPTRVYISSKCCLSLGWALRAVWIVFLNKKNRILLIGVVFVKLIFGLSLGLVLCHAYG